MSVMKLVFDNNAFADLAQKPEFLDSLTKLKRLSTDSRIEVVGSCTLLQELSGLARSNSRMYLATLAHYVALIRGRILKASRDILIEEGENLKPLPFEESLLDRTSVENFLDNLHDPSLAQELFGEVGSLKHKYGETTEGAVAKLLALPEMMNANPKEIAKGYKEWFQDFPENNQKWFEDLFDLTSAFNVANLPHVAAFLGYSLTRYYERMTLGKKNTPNDLFDRYHFADAVVVDTLVTNDGSFSKTAMRIPNRSVDIMNLADLCQLIDQMHTG